MPAENTTSSPWSIPYPSPTGEPKKGATDMQEIAERTTTIFKERLTTISSHGVSFTAASGELIKATAAITITLPSASANATVGVLANGHEVKVGAGAAKIYGDALEGVTPITLTGYQHVVLVSDGTNWFIVSGTPEGALNKPQLFTIEPAGGGVVYEKSVTTSPNTLVTYQQFLVARSGATTEVGCIAKLFRNGSLLYESGGQFQDEGLGPSGASTVIAQYLQAAGGTFTWKVELIFFGTSVSGESKKGTISFA